MTSNALITDILSKFDTAYIDLYTDQVTADGIGTSALNSISGSATRPEITFKAAIQDGEYTKRTNSFKDIIGASLNDVTINSIAVWDSASGGNMLTYETITALNIKSGFGVKINEDDVSFKIK